MSAKVLILLAAGCFANAVYAAHRPGQPLTPGLNFFSRQQDVQLGQEAAQQVRKQYDTVQNPFLQDYIKRVGDRLAATPEARQSGFPFTFALLNVPQVNAFALPGGPMFILSGLLKTVDNEAQLAAVMAHEMSHVILRHGTHEASKANLIQLPAMLAGAVLGNSSILGTLTRLGANSFMLKFSRDAESEADALGSHLMAEAGYNPLEMARFFEKLQSAGGQGNSRLAQFLSDHPNPGNRERAIEAEVRTLPQRSYGFETGEFERAKAQVNALPQPSKRRQTTSLEPGQSTVSGGWQQLRTQTLALSYPGNWQPYGDRESAMITIAPREGIAQSSEGDTQIGLGTVLSYFVPESNRTDLRSASDDLIHHLHTGSPSMQRTGSSRSVRVDGSQGLVTMLESSSPFGGAETDGLLTVMRPQGLFYMVFIAPDQDFARWKSVFQQMIDSIRFNS